MKENYFKTLPDGYVLKKEIDAQKKRTAILFNLVGIIVMVAVFALMNEVRGFDFIEYLKSNDNFLLEILFSLLTYCLGAIAYMFFHELVHGLFYKIFTKEKLKFGLSLSCAYCGVPGIYVKKIPMMVTVLAPFVVFSFVFIPLCFLVPLSLYYLACLLLLASHIGGCVGDLYVFLCLLAFPKDTILTDNGPRQLFYVKNV